MDTGSYEVNVSCNQFNLCLPKIDFTILNTKIINNN